MLETMDTMTADQVKDLTAWFDKNIGTDYEVNKSASGFESEYYIVFFDLEGNEWDKLRAYLKENNITEA